MRDEVIYTVYNRSFWWAYFRGGQPEAREPHAALCLVSCGSFSQALFLLSAAWFCKNLPVVFFVHVDKLIMFAFFSFSYILVIMAKEKCTAKRKYEDEHRAFLTEWESLHFFVERNSKPFCLVCQALLVHFKASNLQRHFWSLHANISRKFPKGTELLKHKLITLKSQAEKQIQVFQKFTKHSETVMLAPYLVA